MRKKEIQKLIKTIKELAREQKGFKILKEEKEKIKQATTKPKEKNTKDEELKRVKGMDIITSSGGLEQQIDTRSNVKTLEKRVEPIPQIRSEESQEVKYAPSPGQDLYQRYNKQVTFPSSPVQESLKPHDSYVSYAGGKDVRQKPPETPKPKEKKEEDIHRR